MAYFRRFVLLAALFSVIPVHSHASLWAGQINQGVRAYGYDPVKTGEAAATEYHDTDYYDHSTAIIDDIHEIYCWTGECTARCSAGDCEDIYQIIYWYHLDPYDLSRFDGRGDRLVQVTSQPSPPAVNAGNPHPACPMPGGNAVGNPVHVGVGNKFQVEIDLAATGPGGISFHRYYNSLDVEPSFLGSNWTSDFSQKIVHDKNLARLYRPDGSLITYLETDGIWQRVTGSDTGLESLHDADSSLVGWRFRSHGETIENYDASGRLTSIVDRTGNTLILAYDTQERLLSITSNTGKYLILSYNGGDRLHTLTDQAGRTWSYQYGDHNNLEYVENPDGTTRQYHYESSDFRNALTGITDERGLRYASFTYDNQGRADTSSHADDAGRVEITYHTDGTRTVTNSKGISSAYTTTTQNEVVLVTGTAGPGCATCGRGNTTYTYDSSNRLIALTGNGITTRYGNYDKTGNYHCVIKGVTATDTSTGECNFDPLASPDARRIDYTYDPRFRNRISTRSEPSVYPGQYRVTTYTYDDYANRTSETIDGYTPDGTPVSQTITYEYAGPLHQLSEIDGPRSDISDITKLRYYPDNIAEGSNRAQLKEIENATGTLVRSDIRYTTTGRVLSELRTNGLRLSYDYYPGNDRIKTLTESDGSTSRITLWSYLASGEIRTITTAYGTPDAAMLTFGYDTARRLNRITDGQGNYIEYTLDTEGNREAEKIYDSSGTLKKALMQTFDVYSRLDTASQANEMHDTDFAPDGTLVQSMDGEGTATGYSYDALRRLLNSTRDLGGTDPSTANTLTQYGYDPADRLTSVTDPVNGKTSYLYDDLGNLLKVTSPDSGITSFHYDAAGNPLQKTDAKGQLFTYQYDSLNRLTRIDAPGTTDDISYSYDTCEHGLGRLCSISRNISLVQYRYNRHGEITGIDQQVTTWSRLQQATASVTYSQDAAGRLGSLTYPSGAVLSYTYDSAGQVTEVSLEKDGINTLLVSGIAYRPFGPPQYRSLGNGLVIYGQYDLAYRTEITGTPSGPFDILTYDRNGNPRSQVTSFGIASHDYDALERLTNSTGPYGSRYYAYDRNGNRTGLDNNSLITAYGYRLASNQLEKIDAQVVTLDANGNTRQMNGLEFSYTADNRLDTVTGVSSYAYNGIHQRVLKGTRLPGPAGAQGNRHQVFIYGRAGELLAETGPTGQVTREYLYLNGELLSLLEHTPVSGEPVLNGDMDQDGVITGEDFMEWFFNHYQSGYDPTYEVTGDGMMNEEDLSLMSDCAFKTRCVANAFDTALYYVINDHLGTPMALSDKRGRMVWSALYDPFGKATVNEDPDENGIPITFHMRFPGQYYDQETGLHYNWHRYYSPELGRYLTSDPVGLDGGSNTYSYALNNPLSWDDPTGLDVWYENTTAVYGLHRRACVDALSGRPYCISFGLPSLEAPQQEFLETSSCNSECRPSRGGPGSGIVYEDMHDPSTGVVDRIRTKRSEDRVIENFFRNQVGNTGPYHFLGNSCRDFSEDIFDLVKGRFLYRHTRRGLRRR